MVVAVLGILFVSGAALLTVVTFSSRSLSSAKIERENRDTFDAVERYVTTRLAQAFLNADVTSSGFANGVPLAMDSRLVMHQLGRPDLPCCGFDPDYDTADECFTNECVVSLPTTASVAGVQPWIDVNEPLENSQAGTCDFQMTSDFLGTEALRPVVNPLVAAALQSNANGVTPERLAVRVNIPEAVRSPVNGGGFLDGAVPFVRSGIDTDGDGVYNAFAVDWRFYNDADGDGVVDGVEMTLPIESLPADLRRSVAARLRADDDVGDPDSLTVTLRIIDNNALINLNYSHPYLKRAGLGYSFIAGPSMLQPIAEPTNEVLFADAPYTPESNEWLLRNRGMLTPLSIQPNRLIASLGSELLCSGATSRFDDRFCDRDDFANELDAGTSPLSNPPARHWWGYDPVADTMDDDSAWRVQMNPANLGNPADASPDERKYNVSHNLTTVSYDDLFIPGFVDASHKDVVEEMKRLDNNADGRTKYVASTRFAIDNYPFGLDGTGDPRLGHIKLSLPELDNMPDLTPVDRLHRVRMLQDEFLLMLRNRRDFNGDGIVDTAMNANFNVPNDVRARAVQAAMLAANFIDYVDNNDTPTRVEVIDDNGNPVFGTDGVTPLAVYGFERQPFITEVYVYAKDSPSYLQGGPVEQSSAIIAIELYNPYESPIVLSDYELTDLSTDPLILDHEINLTPLERLSFESLASYPNGGQIPAKSYATFYSKYCTTAPVSQANAQLQLGSEFGIDDSSVIALVRELDDGSGSNTVPVIVDTMVFDSADPRVMHDDGSALAGGADPELKAPLGDGEIRAISVQRDTTANFWRWTVPVATRTWQLGEASLGADNRTANDQSELTSVYPVHLDTSNEQKFAKAFPTTGSMLLVSRMAHVYDKVASPKSNPSSQLTTAFNRVHSALLGVTSQGDRNILGEFDQIDNGRLPVFGVRPSVAQPRERELPAQIVPGQVEGMDTLPWGQLVFDYFTAIPFVPCANGGVGFPPDPTCNRDYPKVDQEGMRVHGRININTASQHVLANLPMLDEALLPLSYRAELSEVLGRNRPTLGENLARAIVAYREARNRWWSGVTPTNIGDYESARSPYSGGGMAEFRPRLGYGFLTVGELLNVRVPTSVMFDSINPVGSTVGMDASAGVALPDDATADGYPIASFEHSIANMVALEDWVTTRSHVFTIYGVIRGAHQPLSDPKDTTPDPDTGLKGAERLASYQRANQKAIRFQSTVDRLPMVMGANKPVRIGSRITGGYADVRSD